MPRHLKCGMDASAIKAADAKVRETVEHILADIDARKDIAVRELSQKFDNWAPASFKLTPQEIERAIGQMKQRDLDDIKFAQGRACAILRRSRRRRRARSRGGRDAARRAVLVAISTSSVNFDRLLCAGRPLSDGGVGAHARSSPRASPA